MARKVRPVRFRKVSGRAIVQQLEGPEKPYPVYRFPLLKFERPERPGQTYRWLL